MAGSANINIAGRDRRPVRFRVLPSIPILVLLAWTGADPVAAQDLLAHYQRGVALIAEGDHRAAGQEFDRAIALAPRVIGPGQRGPTHLDTAKLQEFRANCHLQCFELLPAEGLYKTCMDVARTEGGSEGALMVRRCLGNLGLVATRLGQWNEAETRYREALQNETDDDNRARTLRNLASLYLLSDRPAQAVRPFEDAMRYWDGLRSDAGTLEAASCRHGLAMVAIKRGDPRTARPLFETALAVRRAGLPTDDRFIGHSTEMLGVTLAQLGEHAAALELLQEAERIMSAYWGGSHVELAEVHHELALSQQRAGNLAGGVAAMTRSRQGYRDYMGGVLAGLSQQEQLSFLGMERHRVMDSYALALRHKDNPQVLRPSWEWVLNTKGFSLEVLAERHLLARDSRTTGPTRELADALAGIRRELAAAAIDGSDEAKVRRSELMRRDAELSRSLGLHIQGAGASEWIAADQVLSQLPADAVLVDFALLDRAAPSASAFGAQTARPEDSRYAAWVVSGADKSVRLLDLGPAAVVNRQVADFRVRVEKAADELLYDPQAAVEKATQNLRTLTATLMGAVSDDIGKAQRVIISPDANLWLVPWAALVLPDGRRLVEQAEVTLVVSGRQLVPRTRAAANPFGVIMADPVFDLDPETARQQLTRAGIDPNRFSRHRSSGVAGLVPDRLAPLPGTRVEADAARRQLESYLQGRVYVYTGPNAQESFLKSVRQPRVLMIATHGFFLAGGPGAGHPLSQCGLYLAGATQRNSVAGTEDGIVLGLEVLDCDFRGTELVVLSACETALGQSANGEGVAGLQSAFQLAGAEHVMATLWQVQDQATAELMSRFWTAVAAGQPPATALRSAQLHYLKSTDAQHQHPWFWGALQVNTQRR